MSSLRTRRNGKIGAAAAAATAFLVAAAVLSPVTAVADDMIEDSGFYGPFYFAELQDADLSGGLLYVFGVGGLDIVDVSNILAPSSLGRYEPFGHPYERYYRGTVAGSIAYAGAREDLLHMIDVGNSAAPALIQKYGTPGMTYEGSALVGDALVACRHGDGVEVIDVSDPLSPVQLAELPALSNAWDAAAVGSHVFVADGAGGLAVLDLGLPASPVHLTSVPTSGNALDVVAAGGLAAVACGSGGVDLFDIATPASPVLLANHDTPGLVVSLELVGDMLYLADWQGIEVVDVSNPASPVPVGREDTPVRAMGLGAAPGLAYVADWSRVRIYEIGPTTRGDVSVSVASMVFLDTPVGATTDTTVTVTNTGGGVLTLTNAQVFNANFSVWPASAVLAAGASVDLTVSYTRATSAADGTFLRLESDDSDEGVLTVGMTAGTSSGQLDIGDTAPDFSLTDLGGAPQSLTRYRGRIVVMAFFANW